MCAGARSTYCFAWSPVHVHGDRLASRPITAAGRACQLTTRFGRLTECEFKKTLIASLCKQQFRSWPAERHISQRTCAGIATNRVLRNRRSNVHRRLSMAAASVIISIQPATAPRRSCGRGDEGAAARQPSLFRSVNDPELPDVHVRRLAAELTACATYFSGGEERLRGFRMLYSDEGRPRRGSEGESPDHHRTQCPLRFGIGKTSTWRGFLPGRTSSSRIPVHSKFLRSKPPDVVKLRCGGDAPKEKAD